LTQNGDYGYNKFLTQAQRKTTKEIINKRHQMFMKTPIKRQADKKKRAGRHRRRAGRHTKTARPCYFAINETLQYVLIIPLGYIVIAMCVHHTFSFKMIKKGNSFMQLSQILIFY